jgi:hypothetical protein
MMMVRYFNFSAIGNSRQTIAMASLINACTILLVGRHARNGHSTIGHTLCLKKGQAAIVDASQGVE